jgi:hypothetical protein
MSVHSRSKRYAEARVTMERTISRHRTHSTRDSSAKWRFVVLALVLTFGVATADASAQGVVSGRIVDAVRGRTVAVGDEVRLLGTDRRAVVDTGGRFAFADLPPGRYEVAHAGLWLDSLGLPPLTSRVEISPTSLHVEATLQTPSRDLYHASLCGGSLGPDASALLGDLRLHDASEAQFATVVASWSELTAGTRGVVRREMRAVANADSTGAYRLCGVPIASNVTLVAEQSGAMDVRMRTDTLVIAVGPGAERLDLVLGPAQPAIQVRGQLMSVSGAPTSGDIVVAGRQEQRASTDSLGAFQLMIAPRSTQLLARSPGYEPITRVIDPVFGPRDSVRIALRPLSEVLDPIRIVESPGTRFRREFDERRESNHQGTFIDDSTWARYPVKSARVLQANVPRSQVDRRGYFYLTFGSAPCRPRLFVDGADMRVPPDAAELTSWLERAKRVEVYRDAFAPSRFADPAGCGAIVIWMQ